ncbi:MAG: hypothetical protein ABR538_16905 [Candidatus Binatia bacterium]
MDLFLASGGGFLAAVIWMDLMFDTLAVGPRAAGPDGAELPEDSLARIATYYRRVTTTASPMNYLVSAVMAGMVLVLVLQLTTGDAAAAPAATSLALCGVPITLALLRVFPNAIRLGTRTDSIGEQSRLARAILFDHLLCFAAMLAFLVVRFSVSA